jgi:hypothetical protein
MALNLPTLLVALTAIGVIHIIVGHYRDKAQQRSSREAMASGGVAWLAAFHEMSLPNEREIRVMPGEGGVLVKGGQGRNSA